MVDVVVVDIDGTLVDSNYHHAVAWAAAFRECEVTVPVWRVHRAIGMGGDHLVAAVAGQRVEAEHGDRVRKRWAELFEPMLDSISPLEGARELLIEVKRRGMALVLASSGKPDHVEHYLDVLAARGVADAWTTSKDVERTKPAPDLIELAIDRVEGDRAVTVGDSIWDCRSAQRCGVPCLGVRTGGFGADELAGAGAVRVYDDLPSLGADLNRLPLENPT
ncbi:MAG: HAD family hydrolase [Kutzneria sp.]|nr:HAD family hydrolase [Kutzneria sp.]